MKRWKLAISLAVVAAIAVPALAGTWRLAPGGWIKLTADQRESIASFVEKTKNCTSFVNEGEYTRSICAVMRSQLASGGTWQPAGRVTLRYVATNLSVAAAAFALTFVLVMFGPPVGRRYLAWLRK